MKLPNCLKIIALERSKIYIDGFAKIAKKIFKFEIVFLQKDYSIELKLRLKYGKTKLEKWENVEFKTKDYGLDIYLAETRQYLLSVYS